MADFTALLDAIQAQVSKNDIRKVVAERILAYSQLKNNFTWQRSIYGGIISPTFDTESSSRPFSTTYSGTDNQTIGAKKLEMRKAKIEQTIDPDKYENMWMTFAENLSLDYTDTASLAKFIIDHIIGVEAQNNREKVIWQAEYNSSGTTSLDICDGFAKRIADAITATAIPASNVVTTGVLDASNTYDAVHDVLSKVARRYRNLSDMQVLVSEDLFGWYIEGFEAAHPNRTPRYLTTPTYDYGVNMQPAGASEGEKVRSTGLILEGKFAGIKLGVEDSMTEAGSQRIIATPQSNLIIASNLADVKDFQFRAHSTEWAIHLLCKYSLAMDIYEYGKDAIAVNDQE
jgi:hypothetical protein